MEKKKGLRITMDEKEVANFWETHPCGDHQVGGIKGDYEKFFLKYDKFRYSREGHILRCLNKIDFRGKKTLEIGLGQGADSEQIIRRGAIWNGLELTRESVNRVKTRLSIRNLPYKSIKQGSVLNIPHPDHLFDIVFSHGVLHHVPDIAQAEKEILRVLKPRGMVIVMLYSKFSLNYLVSITLVRRIGLIISYFLRIKLTGIYHQHLESAKKIGLWNYLRMCNFIHHNTDGPANPYSKVYSITEVKKDFCSFRILQVHKEFMHAPPLPVHGWPGAGLVGWHLWVHMTPK